MKYLFCMAMVPAMALAIGDDIIHRRKEWLGCSSQRLGAWILERMDERWPVAPRTTPLKAPWFI